MKRFEMPPESLTEAVAGVWAASRVALDLHDKAIAGKIAGAPEDELDLLASAAFQGVLAIRNAVYEFDRAYEAGNRKNLN